MDVALVSCMNLPEPDPDAAPLAAALDAAGIRSRVLAWDDPAVEWSRAPMTVFRSSWNYPLRREAFMAWAETTARLTDLWNSLPVVQWNSHKSYLLELERRGIRIASTVLVVRGSTRSLGDILDERGWDEVVIKPAVSCASFRTRHFRRNQQDEGESHLRDLARDGDVLVQQYLPSVNSYGERSLVWIDGEITHSIRKSPRFEGQEESVTTYAVESTAEEQALADRAITAASQLIGQPLLYARADMARSSDGVPVIMELELIEPSLFFSQGPDALGRYVAAIQRRLGAR